MVMYRPPAYYSGNVPDEKQQIVALQLVIQRCSLAALANVATFVKSSIHALIILVMIIVFVVLRSRSNTFANEVFLCDFLLRIGMLYLSIYIYIYIWVWPLVS